MATQYLTHGEVKDWIDISDITVDICFPKVEL